jgi:hypothetical protein
MSVSITRAALLPSQQQWVVALTPTQTDTLLHPTPQPSTTTTTTTAARTTTTADDAAPSHDVAAKAVSLAALVGADAADMDGPLAKLVVGARVPAVVQMIKGADAPLTGRPLHTHNVQPTLPRARIGHPWIHSL